MILRFRQSEKEVCALIDKICADMEKTRYRCAIGYAMYSCRMELERVCQVADTAMYEKKRQMKAIVTKQE